MAYYNPGAPPQTAAMAIPAPVSNTYCVPYVAQFNVDQQLMSLRGGRFHITDPRGTLLFETKNKNILALHERRLISDASGNPLVLLKKKIATMHERWSAYRGEHDHESNVIFHIAKSSLIQFKASFDIFLAKNQTSTPDFTVKGNFFQRNYTVFFNGTPIAEARKKVNVATLLVGKEQYEVTVFPGVDHAFIASIIVIMEEAKHEDSDADRILSG